jgi:hypothetical protein
MVGKPRHSFTAPATGSGRKPEKQLRLPLPLASGQVLAAVECRYMMCTDLSSSFELPNNEPVNRCERREKAATANHDSKRLDDQRYKLILQTCDEILDGPWQEFLTVNQYLPKFSEVSNGEKPVDLQSTGKTSGSLIECIRLVGRQNRALTRKPVTHALG